MKMTTIRDGRTIIDEFSADGLGWARFSGDLKMRYRLARSLTNDRLLLVGDYDHDTVTTMALMHIRVVWLMLNPSTADAFQLDPTVNECVKRTRALGGTICEVVNLFALRSPYPTEIKKCATGYRGDDQVNDQEILAACASADRVIVAWGNDGALGNRADAVRSMLGRASVEMWHLGRTYNNQPKHPLARGKHRIAADQPLMAF